MGILRIFGFVLLAIGVALLFFGYQATQSVNERIVEGFTGHFTDRTMWYLIGGVGTVAAGLGLSIWGGGRATS